VVFATPVGEEAMPLILLGDLGWYVDDHPERSNGMTLKELTEHLHWKDPAETFTEVTGHKAFYKEISLDEYFASEVFHNANAKVGHSTDPNDTPCGLIGRILLASGIC
jgi:hypothetical protein